jgi:hypothetical protein
MIVIKLVFEFSLPEIVPPLPLCLFHVINYFRNEFNVNYVIVFVWEQYFKGTRGSVVGWGTMLKLTPDIHYITCLLVHFRKVYIDHLCYMFVFRKDLLNT